MFWPFWGPTIAFAAVVTSASLVSILPLRLRDTTPATTAEFLARGLWSLSAVLWAGWTIPNASHQFFAAMRMRYINTIWDPVELVFYAFEAPTRIDVAFDRWLGVAAVLLALTALDALAFHLLHRRGSRVAARTVSGTVTVLTAAPVWLMLLVVAVPSVDVWRSLP